MGYTVDDIIKWIKTLTLLQIMEKYFQFSKYNWTSGLQIYHNSVKVNFGITSGKVNWHFCTVVFPGYAVLGFEE